MLVDEITVKIFLHLIISRLSKGFNYLSFQIKFKFSKSIVSFFQEHYEQQYKLFNSAFKIPKPLRDLFVCPT